MAKNKMIKKSKQVLNELKNDVEEVATDLVKSVEKQTKKKMK